MGVSKRAHLQTVAFATSKTIAFNRLAATILHTVVLTARMESAPNRVSIARTSLVTMPCWSPVAGIRTRITRDIAEAFRTCGNCCTPKCATRRTRSSRSLARVRKLNVSTQEFCLYLVKSLFCARRLFRRHCSRHGEGTNSFRSRQNVLLELFNEFSLNRFIIGDDSFWTFLMRFAISVGQFLVGVRW